MTRREAFIFLKMILPDWKGKQWNAQVNDYRFLSIVNCDISWYYLSPYVSFTRMNTAFIMTQSRHMILKDGRVMDVPIKASFLVWKQHGGILTIFNLWKENIIANRCYLCQNAALSV